MDFNSNFSLRRLSKYEYEMYCEMNIISINPEFKNCLLKLIRSTVVLNHFDHVHMSENLIIIDPHVLSLDKDTVKYTNKHDQTLQFVLCTVVYCIRKHRIYTIYCSKRIYSTCQLCFSCVRVLVTSSRSEMSFRFNSFY
jgi:hypothetical protein